MEDETREFVRLSIADGSEKVLSRAELEGVFGFHFPGTSQEKLADLDAGKMVPLCLARYFYRDKQEVA